MNNARISFAGAIAFLFTMVGISEGYMTPQQNEDIKKIRKELIIKFPLPKNSEEINLRYFFPTEADEINDIYIYQSMLISLNNAGDIFIADERAHKIYKFKSSGSLISVFGRKGQGPGEFIMPANILHFNENIIVNDRGNHRMQFFSKTNEYMKSFKVYNTYLDCDIDKNGNIYAVPIRRFPEAKLVDVLSEDGKLLLSFGEPLEFKANWDQLNDGLISLTERGDLYLAFRFFPIIRKYTYEGNLVKEIQIHHDYMKFIENINSDNINKTKKGRQQTIGFSPLIKAFYADADGFYLVRDYPRLEILSFSPEGDLLMDYWNANQGNRRYDDLLVKKTENEILFFLLQSSPMNRIDVFSKSQIN